MVVDGAVINRLTGIKGSSSFRFKSEGEKNKMFKTRQTSSHKMK